MKKSPLPVAYPFLAKGLVTEIAISVMA